MNKMKYVEAFLELPRFFKTFFWDDWEGWNGIYGRITILQTLKLWKIIWLDQSLENLMRLNEK
jgi:hypothetical protein